MYFYQQYFNFDADPFRITPDPDFLFWSDVHRIAGTALETSIVSGVASVLLCGDAGTGKSTLLQYFLDRSDLQIHRGYVWHPTLLEKDFHGTVLSAFGLHRSNADPFPKRLSHHLRTQASLGNHPVLFVEDAQALPTDVLERILQLPKEMQPLTIALFGQPMLVQNAAKCASAADVLTIKLTKLSTAQTEDYVRHRLRHAGCDQNIFDQPAHREIFRATNGNPRLINSLCSRCLQAATNRSLISINAELVALISDIETGDQFLNVIPQAIDQSSAAGLREGPGSADPPSNFNDGQTRRRVPGSAAGTAAKPELLDSIKKTAGRTKQGQSINNGERSRSNRENTQAIEIPAAQPTDDVRKGKSRMAFAAVGVLALGGLAFAALSPNLLGIPAPPAMQPNAQLASVSAPGAFVDLAGILPEDAQGRFRLAVSLADEDPALAVVAYSHAAALGHDRAAYYLGQIFEVGDRVPVDHALARAWYQQAAEGISSAESSLATLSPPEPGPFLAPRPLLGLITSQGLAEVSWTSAPGPDPDSYRIEFASLSSPTSLGAINVSVSATVTQLPKHAERWRVVAIGKDIPDGRPSKWQILLQPQDEPRSTTTDQHPTTAQIRER